MRTMRPKTAKWISRAHLFRRDEYICSACGARADKPYRVCPRCSAPMKGSKLDPVWVDEMADFDELFGE